MPLWLPPFSAMALPAGCDGSREDQSTSPARASDAQSVESGAIDPRECNGWPSNRVGQPIDRQSVGSGRRSVAANFIIATDAERRPAARLSIVRYHARVHDDAQLAELGVHLYESNRLKLYTDIDPEIARQLPEYVDQAYEAMVEYFGPLPPNREGLSIR